MHIELPTRLLMIALKLRNNYQRRDESLRPMTMLEYTCQHLREEFEAKRLSENEADAILQYLSTETTRLDRDLWF